MTHPHHDPRHLLVPPPDASRVRHRALRAARVTTLGLVLSASGCYEAHVAEPAPAVLGADAGEPITFGIPDAGPPPAEDAGLADAGTFCDISDSFEEYSECCDEIGWDWDRGCAAWGPFVPPAEGEVA